MLCDNANRLNGWESLVCICYWEVRIAYLNPHLFVACNQIFRFGFSTSMTLFTMKRLNLFEFGHNYWMNEWRKRVALDLLEPKPGQVNGVRHLLRCLRHEYAKHCHEGLSNGLSLVVETEISEKMIDEKRRKTTSSNSIFTDCVCSNASHWDGWIYVIVQSSF